MRSPVLVLGVLLAIDCSPPAPEPCGPKNCAGCCTSGGACDTAGTTEAACGQGGVACASCGASQVCSRGACTSATSAPISYKPCASNNECNGESCFTFAATNGVCSRACVTDDDCGGGVCRMAGFAQLCHKRCSATVGCRADMRCENEVCRGDSQSRPCADYIACYYKMGGSTGSLDSTYGTGGTCWQNPQTAQSCTQACQNGNASLTQTGVGYDAGCTFPSCDGGVCHTGSSVTQSKACRDYISCYYRTGGNVGSLDSTYGPGGTCWTTSPAAASACTNACQSANDAFISTGIAADAGCTF